RRSRPPARPPLASTSASVGAATVIREFLAAGLIDHMHIAVVPILLGRGVRLSGGRRRPYNRPPKRPHQTVVVAAQQQNLPISSPGWLRYGSGMAEVKVRLDQVAAVSDGDRSNRFFLGR